MALSILDGNQTAVTLATTVSGSQHFPNHIIASGTVTASLVAKNYLDNQFLPLNIAHQEESFGDGARLGVAIISDTGNEYGSGNPLPISGVVTANAGGDFANSIENVNDSGNVSKKIAVQLYAENGIAIGVSNNPLPISGTVTASIAISSTAITKGSFSSLTSATLVPGNVARKMATVYNLGAGQLFVNAGASATTLGGGFMVALSSGDFYECDYTTTTLSAIFATAGTASWVSH